jgi:arylsulfatase
MHPGSNPLFVLAAALTAAAVAAEPPDLAGRWTLVVESPKEGAARPRIPATAGSGWGREITITPEAGRITIERHQFAANDMQPPMRFVYALGGPESRNVVHMGRGAQEEVARAALDGSTLVIVSRQAEGTALAADVRQVFALDPSGDLVVETTRTAGGATSTARARYRRQPPPSLR